MRRKYNIGILMLVMLMLLAGCSTGAVVGNTQTGIVTESESEMETETEIIPTETEEEIQRITLMMLGDNLMHMGIVRSGDQADGTRDYSFMFESLEKHLAYADIKMINQETILGGNSRGFSGFPNFNSPTEVGDAIAGAGFNVVLHASNHAGDQGIKGLLNCVDFWKSYPEILMTGIYEEEENHDIPVLEMDGVTFAILNYTYSPNSETLKKELRGHLGMLCDWNEKNGKISLTKLHPDVITDIKKAKTMADVVIVCPHWGTEYKTVPSTYQKKFAMEMTEAGADVIIGTHPHVVQPVEWIEAENGNRALCYYSLGNYVSTQKNGLSMLEAMAWVTFEVEAGEIRINQEQTGAIPMVCHYTSGPVRLKQVYFLDEYNQELASTHGIRNYGGVNLKMDDLQKWTEEILGEWVLDSQEVLKTENVY